MERVMRNMIKPNTELRALIMRASHLPIYKATPEEKAASICAGFGKTEVSATIKGNHVLLKGYMTARNGIEGPVPIFRFTSWVNGIYVNRKQLILLFGEPC